MSDATDQARWRRRDLDTRPERLDAAAPGPARYRPRHLRPGSQPGFDLIDGALLVLGLVTRPGRRRSPGTHGIRLSYTLRSPDLSRYRTIAFATHGLLAGEFPGLAEPALALSPPAAGEGDDGLLTASEVAGLDLDADLVVLSACNTAGPGGEAGAEGLSGLARAFFYAGSRALLVSHWYVDSEATAWLTRETAAALQSRPDAGLASALRTSTLAMLQGRAGLLYRHPIFWAPFVAVGEGARPRERSALPS